MSDYRAVMTGLAEAGAEVLEAVREGPGKCGHCGHNHDEHDDCGECEVRRCRCPGWGE
jgi:hypothetical protein